MANSNRWSDFKGGLANLVASGKVYNKYTNTYAPQNVTGTRLAAGAVGQFGGPLGTLAAMTANQLSKGMDGAQHFDRTLETAPSFADERARLQQSLQGNLHPGVNVGDVGDAPSMGGQLSGMVGQPYQFGEAQPTVSGLANTPTSYGVSLPNYGGSQSQGPSNYGPYQGGYQFGSQQPTTSGLANTQTSYGVSLPNYGGSMNTGGNQQSFGGQPQGPQMTPQQQAEADRIANNNRYSGPSTFASPNERQTGGDMWGHAYDK